MCGVKMLQSKNHLGGPPRSGPRHQARDTAGQSKQPLIASFGYHGDRSLLHHWPASQPISAPIGSFETRSLEWAESQ